MESNQSIFEFRGLQVDVHASAPAPLRWLEEFMSPSLNRDGQVDARRNIRVSIDGQRHAHLRAHARPEPQQAIDCFTKDGAFEQLAVWHDDGQGEMLYSAAGECFLAIDRGGESIELIAPADHGLMRRCLMRLVRELAMIHAMHRGDLFIHAAAVECRGEAILVTGARRSGKTTMLINALRQPGVRYLANDRVFVEHGQGAVRVRGMPTIIAVRAESFAHLSGLKLPEWGHPWRHYLTMRECEAGSPLMLPPFQDPPAMNPAQFCRWLGVEPVTDAPLRAVVLPRVDASVPGFALDRHGPEDGARLLRSNLFRSGPNGPVATAFAWGWEGAAPDEQAIGQRCREITGQCAILTCRIGPAAFGSPNVWEAITAAAFDSHSKGSA